MTGYRKSPSSSPLPVNKLHIDGVDDVVALVDSGASSSAVRRSISRKLDNCVGPSVRFRWWDSKSVAIDSFVNIAVRWEGRQTALKRVASVKHPPFPVILGVDWIIASKTDFLVKDEKLVPVSQPAAEEVGPTPVEKKSVRFGDLNVKVFRSNAISGSVVSEHTYQCGEEEEALEISDELICSFQEERRKRKKTEREGSKSFEAHADSNRVTPIRSL